MPLSERTRVEVYLPDLKRATYRAFLRRLEKEFCHTFGGATVVRGLDGAYLSQSGVQIHDRINILYSDIPLTVSAHFAVLGQYADYLRKAALDALDEEAILVAIMPVFHAVS